MSFNIIYNLTDVKSASNNPTAIDTTATVVLETMYGYDLPDTVTVTGADGSWDKTTGTLSLSNPTSDVTITAVGAQIHYINVANLKKFWTELSSKLKIGSVATVSDIAYGTNSIASGGSSCAYGNEAFADSNSTAIGYNANAFGSAVAVGYSAQAKSGSCGVAVGRGSYAKGIHSVAIGCYSMINITDVVTFSGWSSLSGEKSRTILLKSTSNIFFTNEAFTSTTNEYSSLSSFVSGKTLKDYLDSKQDSLVSGTNIKTINGYSVLGSGNLNVSKCVALYSGSCGYSVTLNTNYNVHDDFDILIVFCQYNSADSQQSHTVIDTAWCDNMNNSYNFNIHENVVKLQYNPQTHVLWNDNNNCMIYKVLGIKFYNN